MTYAMFHDKNISKTSEKFNLYIYKATVYKKL